MELLFSAIQSHFAGLTVEDTKSCRGNFVTMKQAGRSIRGEDYHHRMGTPDDWAAVDPITRFHEWLRQAEASEPNDPNAAALATSTANGVPSVRMILVKRVDERGCCFFTNAKSEKGRELADNPRAALCFHWKSLRRQVRVIGTVTELENSEVDAYFHSRSRNSQMSAAVSAQSRPLGSREELVSKIAAFAERHPGDIPRPPHWGGYCVSVDRIEFWMDGADRLHDRVLFARAGDGWTRTRLFP
jgi:pyridoxamine 5'-phosphate oxidase